MHTCAAFSTLPLSCEEIVDAAENGGGSKRGKTKSLGIARASLK
jgi:hypothetical protein